jgi:hypothetical protein
MSATPTSSEPEKVRWPFAQTSRGGGKEARHEAWW